MTTSKGKRPKLNQDCCGELGAIRCGENCPICFGYDLDGEIADEYYRWEDLEAEKTEDGKDKVVSPPKETSIDFTDMKEWPELSSCDLVIITDDLVEAGTELFTEEDSWHM